MPKNQLKVQEHEVPESDAPELAENHGDIIYYEDYKKRKTPEETKDDSKLRSPEHESKNKEEPAKLSDVRPEKVKPEKEEVATSASSGFTGAFMDIFAKDMAIDLGTANTLLYMKRKGIVLNEPSVVALRRNSQMENKVLAVGAEAKKMLGRSPGNITAIRPMRDGVIADFEVAGAMIKHFIRKVRKGLRIFKPRVMVAVPSGITQVEKRAVKETIEQAGARQVFMIEEPIAAAIGAGLDITEPKCNMIIDIGGGTTEVAIISLAGIVSSKSLRIAGDEMDNAIMRYIKRKYNFVIGESTAEMIKITIGNAYPDIQRIETADAKGRDMLSGTPRIIKINSEEIREAIAEQIYSIIQAIKTVLEQTPPELAGDIVDNGIVLTGGVALLKNLDKYLTEETGVLIKVAQNPLATVALGSGMTLDSLDLLKQVAIT